MNRPHAIGTDFACSWHQHCATVHEFLDGTGGQKQLDSPRFEVREHGRDFESLHNFVGVLRALGLHAVHLPPLGPLQQRNVLVRAAVVARSDYGNKDTRGYPTGATEVVGAAAPWMAGSTSVGQTWYGLPRHFQGLVHGFL